jgi:hypothetical protein
MIYELVSIKTIIYKVINDLGIGDKEIEWQDWVDWIADGLQHIGSYYQFQEKEEAIEIENYKGYLPCDFYQKIRIVNTNFSRPNHNKSLIGDDSKTIYNNSFTGNDYNINNNTITTSFKSGSLILQYLAIPLDKDKLPMVPDNVSFRDALFWKVVYHLSLRGFEFRNPQLRDLQFTRSMWLRYCNQARAEANMPDPDMYERLKNNWMRLMLDKNQYNKLFADLSNQENLNLKGKSFNNFR